MHDVMQRMADVWKTCNKIRAAVFRVGVNLWDWYRPLDPDGNTLISESKFVSVLAGGLRAALGLSDAEVAQLADYFRAADGRVLYHQLCLLIHGEDAGAKDLVSADCALEACAPPPPARPALDDCQARRLCCLLATIADRQLPLKPYFQDYELVAKTDGRVTFAHFARILSYVGLLLSAEDYGLLVRRFIRDSYTVDYVEFLAAIEDVKRLGVAGLGPEYQNPKATIDTALPKTYRPEVDAGASTAALGEPALHPALHPPPPPRALLEAMLRAQEYVLKNRIRPSEFLRDYDPLNSGRVSPENFRRALDAMGLGRALRDAELQCVMRHYADPNDPRRVCWRTFEDDCDQVFTVKELEKHPSLSAGAAAAAVRALAPAGAAEPGGAVLDECAAAVLRLRAACRQRGLDLRPAFRDHDERGNGHVSAAALRRALARAGVLLARAQLAALEARYADDLGFNYFALLDELEVRPAEPSTGAGAPPPPRARRAEPDPGETDIVLILAKIKGKMVREGKRPFDFLRQFDPRRAGVVPRADFYRGLAAAGLALAPREMDTLMEVFAAPGRRRLVEYVRFSDTVGEALAQGGLERAPLLEPVPHVPPPTAAALRHLNYEERALAAAALGKLAKYPDQVANLREVFQDMDRQRCGSVPRRCVERALSVRGVLHVLSPRERDVLYKCFSDRRGSEDEVNHRGLMNAVDLVFANAAAQPC